MNALFEFKCELACGRYLVRRRFFSFFRCDFRFVSFRFVSRRFVVLLHIFLNARFISFRFVFLWLFFPWRSVVVSTPSSNSKCKMKVNFRFYFAFCLCVLCDGARILDLNSLAMDSLCRVSYGKIYWDFILGLVLLLLLLLAADTVEENVPYTGLDNKSYAPLFECPTCILLSANWKGVSWRRSTLVFFFQQCDMAIIRQNNSKHSMFDTIERLIVARLRWSLRRFGSFID